MIRSSSEPARVAMDGNQPQKLTLNIDGMNPDFSVYPDGRQVAFERKLFFDKRLSRDGTLSCSGCHDPASAFSHGAGIPGR